ncbi:hypothetical protein JCM11641_004684, partial [Rhodosporidiobolus odoratus]
PTLEEKYAALSLFRPASPSPSPEPEPTAAQPSLARKRFFREAKPGPNIIDPSFLPPSYDDIPVAEVGPRPPPHLRSQPRHRTIAPIPSALAGRHEPPSPLPVTAPSPLVVASAIVHFDKPHKKRRRNRRHSKKSPTSLSVGLDTLSLSGASSATSPSLLSCLSATSPSLLSRISTDQPPSAGPHSVLRLPQH